MPDANAKLVDRAFRAYVAADGCAAEQPTRIGCSVESLFGRRYVALRNSRRTLAVYRVRSNGQLRRLRVWPIELVCCEREASVKSIPTGEAAYV